ncbi:MAG: hypothetical protein IT311_04380 [Anaerolineales bacterium]|nr:hypothetical protein [Anaerolineales bacterium]MCZ2122862.1 hypothetical protein [Anaerolineales bacterium]
MSILFILILASVFVAASFVQAAEPAIGLALQSKAVLPQTFTDLSEVGSTTGIFIMGVVILLIVTLPLIFRRKWK